VRGERAMSVLCFCVPGVCDVWRQTGRIDGNSGRQWPIVVDSGR
jgi:hypothetical protein